MYFKHQLTTKLLLFSFSLLYYFFFLTKQAKTVHKMEPSQSVIADSMSINPTTEVIFEVAGSAANVIPKERFMIAKVIGFVPMLLLKIVDSQQSRYRSSFIEF
ncbi:unnamed protein product [Mucor hiemalis]